MAQAGSGLLQVTVDDGERRPVFFLAARTCTASDVGSSTLAKNFHDKLRVEGGIKPCFMDTVRHYPTRACAWFQDRKMYGKNRQTIVKEEKWPENREPSEGISKRVPSWRQGDSRYLIFILSSIPATQSVSMKVLTLQ